MEIISKNAMIRLRSTHSSITDDDGNISVSLNDSGLPESEPEVETIEMDSEGTLRVCDDRIEIEYFETELTGMEGACTSISFERDDPGLVTMLRTGTVETVLVFEEGQRNRCTYSTPEMNFELTVRTWDLRNDMTEDGGELELDYSLEFHGVSTEHTKITISVSIVK